MKTRTIATLTALTLSALTGLSAQAEGSAGTVAQPVDGIEVIVVRAKRPETLITDEATVAEAAPIAAAPASGTADEIEVITVTATRADQLAAIRELAREAFLARAAAAPRMPMLYGGGVPRGAYRNWAGMPIR
jgi:hypothetical protein